MASTRRLAAILAADVAGYSRLMEADEEGTLERLKTLRREVIDPKIKEHYGRIVKTTGDGLLAEFGSTVDALRCASAVQAELAERNATAVPEDRIEWRIGIHQGDIVVEDGDIFGDGVNIAARLEGLAPPGGVCVSARVQEDVAGKIDLAFQDLGEQQLKNIARPVHVYAIRPSAAGSTLLDASPAGWSSRLGRAIVGAAAAVVLVVACLAWWLWPAATFQGGTPADRATASATPMPAVPAATSIAQPLLAPRLSIVVLPFANLSNDPDQEYFADGITDDLTTDLSRISGSFVIARNTAFTYKGKPVDAKQIGRELGVRYVLEGSVRRTADQVRVNVQLIDAETGAHVWADRFDTSRVNLPEAQNEITARLARSLNVELLRDASRRIEQEKTVDPDARDLVMRGWAWWYQPRSLANTQEARQAFERALTLDPRSVDAKTGLATAFVTFVGNGWSGSVEQDQARAEELLRKALERDPDQSKAHYAMAALRQTQHRPAEAQIEAEKAIALDPNYTFAHYILGQTLLFMGQPQAAIPHIEIALRLSPNDPNIFLYFWGLGVCQIVLGDVDRAIDFFRRAQAANAAHWVAHLWLAGALGLKGDINEAKTALAESLKLNPRIDSLAHYRAQFPYVADSPIWALLEKTWVVGLRSAGFADQ
jgi:TolB-like protein/class 3 adenylate cyclase/Tfp pilus assembly protein PilF